MPQGMVASMSDAVEHKRNGRRFQTTATGEAFGLNQGGFSGAQTVISKNISLGMLEEFLPQDRHIRNRIFRDIYYHDAIAGGAVDIYATIPWSDFYLVGLRDKEVLDTYHKSVENMRLKLLLPAITRDYLTLGTFIGTTVYDEEQEMFTAVMPQNIDFCTITEVPFYGMDPLIDLKIPDSLNKILSNKNDPRVRQLLEQMPDYMQKNFKAGASIPLLPESTLYIPRRSLSSDSMGTSFYERILPIHLMEKALWRGSIDQAYRRQRAILHIMVGGDGDDYVPTMADMEAQRDLWLAADMDPTGAIIVTRTGIQPNEVRNASDFWRVDEVFDFFSTAKYRALGINESFITGEAQFNVMDAAMTVFIEGMRSFRSLLTQEIFYQKIFPAIAVSHDYTKDRYQMLGKSRVMDAVYNASSNSYMVSDDDGDGESRPYGFCADTRHGLNIHDAKINTEDLAMPHIMWQKHLRPEGDEAYLQLLASLEEKGVPVPLSAMALAGGIDIYAVLNNQEEELKLRKRVKQYQDKLADYMPEQPQGGEEETQASILSKLNRLNGGGVNRFGIKRPQTLLGREYDDKLMPHDLKKNGQPRNTSRKRQHQLYSRINKSLAEAMSRVAQRENHDIRKNRKRKTMIHNRLGKI